MNAVPRIPVRHRGFAAEQLPRYFFDDNPFLSALLVALSLTFPEGERFFVHSVRAVRDQVRDPQLQKDISGFIGQEAMHSRAHEQFNRWAARLGLDIDTTLREEQQAIALAKQKLSPRQQLAVTCALEHFTAMIAQYLLSHPEFLEGLHPEVKPLWLWHALEETEHKAVAFDVYRTVFADEKTRKAVMRFMTVSFLGRMTHLTFRFLQADPAGRRQWQKNWQGMRWVGRLLWALKPHYLEYYRDDFHPDDVDSTALTQQWSAWLDEQTRQETAVDGPLAGVVA